MKLYLVRNAVENLAQSALQDATKKVLHNKLVAKIIKITDE
jgi:hypothetical protein